MTPFLSVRRVKAFYGRVMALKGVDLDVNEGEIVTLIGANGAGKSTLMMTICGNPRAREGTITFAGRDITQMPTHEIARLKLAQAPEGRRIFSRMTVLENLLVAMGHHAKVGLLQEILNPVAVHQEEKKFVEKAMELLNLLEVADFANALATSLPYGNQRRVEMARALATDPKVILLDEPAAGLNEVETEDLRKTLMKIRDLGVTIFLVEHDMKLVMEVCEEISVLDYGKKIAEGTGAAISKDPVVIEAYLGQEEDK